MGDRWRAGGYQWMQEKKRREERDRFNREQIEAEAAAAAAAEARERERERRRASESAPAKGLGQGAYQSGGAALEPAPEPTSERGKPTLAQGLYRAAMVISGLVAAWALVAVLNGADDAVGPLIVAGFLTLLFYYGQKGYPGKAPASQGGGSRLTGEVRGVQVRMEAQGNTNLQVLSFRVERYDSRGNRLTPVPVQMRGQSFEGSLQEGDQVRLIGERGSRGILKVKQLENLTTRSTVRAKQAGGGMWVANLVFLLFIAALIIGCLVAVDVL